MFAPSIVITNRGSKVGLSEVMLVASALQRQVIDHFAPHWNLMASVRAATPTEPARGHEWQLELRPPPSTTDVLGYHSKTPAGMPMMWVFPELDGDDGVPWSTTASHEIMETLVDPLVRRCVQAPDNRIWCLEIVDPVEGDSYFIGEVEVSNFCLPQWCEPPDVLDGVKFDYMNLCDGPFEVRPGGYAQTWDGAKWVYQGERRPARIRASAFGLGRGQQRAHR